jgi:hypothetical protein
VKAGLSVILTHLALNQSEDFVLHRFFACRREFYGHDELRGANPAYKLVHRLALLFSGRRRTRRLGDGISGVVIWLTPFIKFKFVVLRELTYSQTAP